MIPKFDGDTALLLIDVQKGVDVLEHWGGRNGRRNNPNAEKNMAKLLAAWRRKGLPVAFTMHDSREAASPLKLSLPTGGMKTGFDPEDDDIVVCKDVNSGFIGTSLEIQLRRARVQRLIVAGFFTNMCVETTVRMAGNLGFDTYLAHDGCATTNRIGLNGAVHSAESIHNITVANLHGEFCTAISTEDALALLEQNNQRLHRVQGNE